MSKTITTRRKQVNPLEKKPLASSAKARRALERREQEQEQKQKISRSELQDLGLLDKGDEAARPDEAEYTVTYLPLEKLHRHPKNRVAGDTAVAELCVSIQQHGLQQPIKVRLAPDPWGLPVGHYQIVFGERRWRAAQMAGLEQIPAHVVELDDATTLELIAVENAQREDLDPIQRAELIETLCTSIEEGGAGKTRTEAAAVVGLESGSAASNLVRLLHSKRRSSPPTVESLNRA